MVFKQKVLPPTGSDDVLDGCAVGRSGTGLRGPAYGAEAEGVQTSRVHPLQYAATGGAAVVRVDDRQPVSRRPVQFKVIVVGFHRAAPGDL